MRGGMKFATQISSLLNYYYRPPSSGIASCVWTEVRVMDHSWLGTALLSCLRVGTAWGLYSDLVWGLCQLGFLSTLLATQMECYTLHLRLWNEKRNLWFFIEPCVLPSLFVTSKGDYYWNKKAMETLFKRILSRTTKNSKSLNILVILKALF